MPRRPWLGIWVRGALLGAAYLDLGSCWPPPPPSGQPLISLTALGHYHLPRDHLSSLCWPEFLPRVPADKSLPWLCSNHLPLPHDALSGWSSPPVPWLTPHPARTGTPSLQGTLPWTTIFTRIQLEEGRVTGTKKMIHVIDQASFLPPFLGVPY